MNSFNQLSAAILVVLQSVTLACAVKGGEADGDESGGYETADWCDGPWSYSLRTQSVASTVEVDLIAAAGDLPRWTVVLTADGRVLAPGMDGAFAPVLESPMGQTLRAVAVGQVECVELEPCDDPIGLAVGDGGVARRSVDGGQTWTPLDVGSTADLHAAALVTVKMPDESRKFVGLIAGDGVLLRSDDLGATWVPVELTAEQTGSFRALAGGLQRLVAVGDGGLAIASVDGGVTWESYATNTTAELVQVVLERERVVAVTAAGELVIEGGDAVFETVVPSAPVVDVGLINDVGLVVLTSDGRVVSWPEEDQLAQPAAVSFTPRALTQGLNTLVVGEGGAIASVAYETEESCSQYGVGRPFLVEGAALAAAAVDRGDWCEAVAAGIDGLDPAQRERLAAAWARDAAGEHASVAAFARWIVELLACGAPPALVAAAQAAIADEIEHARLCFGLASAYAGRPVGPGPLPVARTLAVSSDMSELALSTFVEGCVGETIAAVEAGYAASLCSDRAVAQVLRTIAADERRHAELAWRALGWALECGGAEVRSRVEAALRRLGPPPVADEDDGDPARGRLGSADRRALAEVTMREVIVPSARRLLDGRRGASGECGSTASQAACTLVA